MDWSPARGSEQAGRRPGLVVSINSLNQRVPVVTVAAVSTKIKPFGNVAPIFPKGQPFPEESQVLCFQLTTAARERLGALICRLDPAQMTRVDAALRLCWGL